MFAGYAGLTQAIKRVGKDRVIVRDPHDTKYGHDILKDEEFTQMVEDRTPPEKSFPSNRALDCNWALGFPSGQKANEQIEPHHYDIAQA